MSLFFAAIVNICSLMEEKARRKKVSAMMSIC